MILNPNCSEAVFRFYTLDPKKIQYILQSIADEVSAETDFGPHKNQKIPLFEKAEDYERPYNKISKKEWDRYFEVLKKIDERLDKGEIDKSSWEKLRAEEWDKLQAKRYPKGSLLYACAGLGDNEAVITIEKDKGAFVLNIGNNDIAENKTGWIEKIKALGIKAEEAELCEELKEKYARDCTCGIVYGLQEE